MTPWCRCFELYFTTARRAKAAGPVTVPSHPDCEYHHPRKAST